MTVIGIIAIILSVTGAVWAYMFLSRYWLIPWYLNAPGAAFLWAFLFLSAFWIFEVSGLADQLASQERTVVQLIHPMKALMIAGGWYFLCLFGIRRMFPGLFRLRGRQ